ncbi:urease accessory protein [Isoptericola jiangsuensis]|uniref:Urease accessory protein n=1 Tax=Isoptericola jiangsuensis TaxID=548579 RepID=A0A2A9EVE0_9MICO|nr:urease accessory UreF family protein [Isoptericola jiangsuensis]PFG42252.1 urease accessory protein [Isoptericola jiangsuensis]
MTSPHALSVAMLLADARLPGGGHAHSASLEPALLGGLPERDVPAWMIGRATTVSLVEAGTAVVAAKVLATAEPAAVPPIGAVVAAWAARTPAPALRDAARLLGRGYLRVARTLWPAAPAVRALVAHEAAHGPLPRAVVLGGVAAATGLPPADVVRLTVYDDAQTAASAFLKLAPCDPLVPARWVLDACAAAEELVPLVAACTTPEDVPASGAPQTEGWAQAHALTNQRLFRA